MAQYDLQGREWPRWWKPRVCFPILQFWWLAMVGFGLPEEPMHPPRLHRIGHSIGNPGILDEPGSECSLCLAEHWGGEVGELLRFGHSPYCRIGADLTWGRFHKGCTCVLGTGPYVEEELSQSGLQLLLVRALGLFQGLGWSSGEVLLVVLPPLV